MSDLDTALRDMLRDRAQDVTTLPLSFTTGAADATSEPLELVDTAPVRLDSRRSRTTMLVAAAVVAAAAVGTAVAIATSRSTEHRVAPAAPPASLQSCRVDATPAWLRALRSPAVALTNALSLGTVYGADTAGDAIVSYVPSGHTTYKGPPLVAIGKVAPGSHTVTPLTSIGGADMIATSSFDGTDLLVTLNGGSAGEQPQTFMVVNVVTGAVQTVLRHAAGVGGDAFVADGVFYYEVQSAPPHPRHSDGIFAVDLATGVRTQLAGRRQAYHDSLATSGLGVWWTPRSDAPDRPRVLPSVVATHAVGPDASAAPTAARAGFVLRSSFQTDGRAWAWETPSGAVDWWSADTHQLRTIRHVLVTGRQDSQPGAVLGVAGPYVIVVLPTKPHYIEAEALLDVRTGTITRLPGNLHLISGRPGELLVVPSTAQTANPAIVRIPTSTLPELRC